MTIKLDYFFMKGMIMMFEDILQEKLKIKCENNRDDYVQLVANWFAYVVLKNKKYKIDHSFDFPWDNSGIVKCIDKQFDLSDYATFNDFLENEYTGASYPSYVSGHGLNHSKYKEELENITFNWLILQISLVIRDLIDNENIYLREWVENQNILFNVKEVDKITDIIFDEDITADYFYNYLWEMNADLLNTHPIILFNRGQNEAIEKIRKEEIKEKERQKERERNIREAKYLWNKLSKMFKLKYGEEMPIRIDKPLYDEKVKQLLIETYKNGSTIDQIQNIGKCLSSNFSQSVTTLISSFNLMEG